MGLRINTNVQSLSAQRFLGVNSEHQKTSLERLASGSRINKAADDAAGLGISEKLKGDIRSLRQASKNANDGISLIQVAEGGMSEIGNILSRLRELSIQGASDTVNMTERSFINKEVQQMKAEVDRITSSTEFDGTHLLNGSAPVYEIQVGIHNSATADRFTFEAGKLVTSIESLGLSNVSSETKEASQNNLEALDAAMQSISTNRAYLGALQNRFVSTIASLGISRESAETANSRIRDTDMAEESSELVKNNILSQANLSVLAQANQGPQMALKLLQ